MAATLKIIRLAHPAVPRYADSRYPGASLATLQQIQQAESGSIGSKRQVAWAREIIRQIQRHYSQQVLPSHPFAAWWIDHRDETLVSLIAHSQDISGPFTTTYPYHDSREAVAVLKMLGRFQVVDTETTGLGKGHEIVELAICDQDAKPIYHTRVRPANVDAYAKSKAATVCSLTIDDLRAAPTLAEVWPDVLATIAPSDGPALPLVAYNANFDGPMLRRSAGRYGLEVPPLELTCAMKLTTSYLNSDDHVTLDEACERLGVDRTVYGPSHTALADAQATAALIRAMKENRIHQDALS